MRSENEGSASRGRERGRELLMKRKDKFIEKFMASQRLLDYFAIQ